MDTTGESVLNQAPGNRVLILGAAGGVGIMAVQFAKLAGAFVAGTASTRNTEFLKEKLGIDEVINYTTTTIAEHMASSGHTLFDLVLDCVGGKALLDGWDAVAPHGSYISVVPGFTQPQGGKRIPEGVKSKFFIMKARGEELERIGKFFEKGMLKTCVDSVWKLEEYEKAFEKTGTGHARGKIVLRVGGKN
jgi:NADPH:quinone reductase-like Zn-dependent oxidoreductase